jgi:hypothetical protein
MDDGLKGGYVERRFNDDAGSRRVRAQQKRFVATHFQGFFAGGPKADTFVDTLQNPARIRLAKLLCSLARNLPEIPGTQVVND